MRSLDFTTRSNVAKEAILRVCEEAGLREADASRRPDPRIMAMLAPHPDLNQTGSHVQLSITSANLNLTVIETGEVCLSPTFCNP